MFPATPTWEGQVPPYQAATEGFYPIPPAWIDHVVTPTVDQAVHHPISYSGIPNYMRLDEVHPSWFHPVVQPVYAAQAFYGGFNPGVPVASYQAPMGHVIPTPENHGMYSIMPTLNPYVAVQPIAYPHGYNGCNGLPTPNLHDPRIYPLEQYSHQAPITNAPAPRKSPRRPKAPKLKTRKDKVRKIKVEPRTFEAQWNKVKKEVE